MDQVGKAVSVDCRRDLLENSPLNQVASVELSECAVERTVSFRDLKLSAGSDVGGQNRKDGANERYARSDAGISSDA